MLQVEMLKLPRKLGVNGQQAHSGIVRCLRQFRTLKKLCQLWQKHFCFVPSLSKSHLIGGLFGIVFVKDFSMFHVEKASRRFIDRDNASILKHFMDEPTNTGKAYWKFNDVFFCQFLSVAICRFTSLAFASAQVLEVFEVLDGPDYDADGGSDLRFLGSIPKIVLCLICLMCLMCLCSHFLVSKRCFADGQSLHTPVTNIQGTRASFLACSELKSSMWHLFTCCSCVKTSFIATLSPL